MADEGRVAAYSECSYYVPYVAAPSRLKVFRAACFKKCDGSIYVRVPSLVTYASGGNLLFDVVGISY